RWLGWVLMLAVLSMLVACGTPSSWLPGRARTVRVAYVGGSTSAVVAPLLDAFRDGMRQHGYAEGQQFTLEPHVAEGRPERLPELAAEVAASGPDLILVSGDQAIRAVQAATTTIP